MKRVAIYVRVSTIDKQDYQRQINDLASICYADGYQDNQIEIFAEKISGYKKEEQHELQAMMSKIDSNNKYYERIYVTEISRLGRNPVATRQLIDKLTEAGVPVYIKSIGQSTLDKDGKRNMIMNIVLQVLLEFANEEAEVFKARSKSGVLSAVKKGHVSSGASIPFGYRNENKMMVIDEEQAKVVKLIYQMYAEGTGTKVIANRLNALGYRGKKSKWTDVTTLGVLRNPVYKGMRYYQGEYYPAPAIVDESLWIQCNDIRETKTHRNYLTTYTYLLKDMCTCGCCNRNYFAKYKPVKNGDKTYMCSSKLVTERTCTSQSVSISLLESAIYHLLLNSKEILQYIGDTSNLKLQLNRQLVDVTADLDVCKNQLADKQKEISRLLDIYVSSNLDKSMYVTKSTELESQRKILEDKIGLYSKSKNEIAKSLATISTTKATKQMLLDAAKDRTKLQAIYQQLIAGIVIQADKDIANCAIRFKIGGIESQGILYMQLDKKAINKAVKYHQYRYRAVFVHQVEDDSADDIFENLDWIIIPKDNILKVTTAEFG